MRLQPRSRRVGSLSKRGLRPVPIRARAAVHTGDAELRGGDYYGPAVNRCARLRSIAHGGQAIVSEATRDAAAERLPADVALLDLGLHRLKDLARPERVFQICHDRLPHEFPPLASLERARHNLPLQLTRFLGREEELREVARVLESSRLVTLTGPGGTGKTRLTTSRSRRPEIPARARTRDVRGRNPDPWDPRA